MRIFLGADHGGFELKEKVKGLLSVKEVEFEDLGNLELDYTDDYPDYAFKVAERVGRGEGLGILICRSGVGVCVAANKYKGVRAAQVFNPTMAGKAREDDGANVMCLGGDYLAVADLEAIIENFIETDFSPEARHRRRVEKILSKEAENFK